MSGKMAKINGSFTSMPYVRKNTERIQQTPLTPEVLPTKYGEAEVLSRPSNSQLAEVYKTEKFVNDWANNVPFHVARNVLHLRRYRGLSQSKLAKAMGTSQSAVARIESAQENITLDTLQRLVGALKGRFQISISPEEYRVYQARPWWEIGLPTKMAWTVVSWAANQTTERDQLIVGLERKNETIKTETLTPGAVRLLPRPKSTQGV